MGCSRNRALDDQVAAREARLLLETWRKLSRGYEHLTEVLADVEVDIFRPWVEHAAT
jgi:hypothetical protein